MNHYFKIVRVGGTAYRAHWSLALVVLIGLALPIGAALYVALILAHEIGHAMVVRRFRGRVDSIDVHVFGGFCRYTGVMSDRQRAIIAWGGVVMQAIILAIAYPFSLTFSPIDGVVEQQVFGVLVGANLLMIATNLLPVAPLDGDEAWKVVGMSLRARKREQRKSKEQRAQEIMDEIGSLRVSSKKPSKLDVN